MNCASQLNLFDYNFVGMICCQRNKHRSEFINSKLRMIREIVAQLPQQKESIVYQGTKEILSRLIHKLPDEKSINQDKKEAYLRTFKSIDWDLTKVQPNWPDEIEVKVDALKGNLMNFQNQLTQISKGSSLFCGSGGNPKELEKTFRTILTYEHFFEVIGIYQIRESKEKLVEQVLEIIDRDKGSGSRFTSNKKMMDESSARNDANGKLMCQYCELMLSVSICPNGYIAKKLVKELPDTEWIAGILYEEGTVVDKNLDKAILYYEQARKKKNAEAIYKLGSLNERGLYGKPNEYLQMWEEASRLDHLEAQTDMGYLYENGLYDEETGKELLAPNEEKALKYYLKASEKNFPRALNNLATFYYNSKNYNNPKECLKYLERASEAEYVKSLHNLALIYLQGTMVDADEHKGSNLLKRAAQKGDIEARILYIQRALNDVAKCSEDDFLQLHKYCRELIAKDEELPEPYYFLGILTENGYACNPQPKIALLYYSIAASYRSEAAYLKLGDCYKNGFGIEQDSKEAIRCYEQVVKSNPLGLVYLGEMYEKGGPDLKVNYEKAFQYYYQACNHEIPEAFEHVGNMYAQGNHVNKNKAKAQQYYEKAKNIQGGKSSKLNASSSELIQSSYYRRR